MTEIKGFFRGYRLSRLALLVATVGKNSLTDCFLPKGFAFLPPCLNPFLWRRARDFSEAVASLASLCSLPPSAKTVHRTVFFRKPLAFSLLVRIPFYYKKTKPPQRMALFFYGGEQGISPRLLPLSPRFARCHRRQKQSTGLFSSESLWLSPSLFESLSIIKKQNHPNGWLCFFMAESKGFEPSNRL
ncbi:hypothetical protein [uncultured Eubacterium sp.]|uniref:hypothetical protein n=1 Tax=uncultured Eubacterium sp. TaxID=165185 RepID=UPI0025E912D6|nr:hypothetical protein [uncultured Eubacterium sp.]